VFGGAFGGAFVPTLSVELTCPGDVTKGGSVVVCGSTCPPCNEAWPTPRDAPLSPRPNMRPNAIPIATTLAERTAKPIFIQRMWATGGAGVASKTVPSPSMLAPLLSSSSWMVTACAMGVITVSSSSLLSPGGWDTPYPAVRCTSRLSRGYRPD